MKGKNNKTNYILKFLLNYMSCLNQKSVRVCRNVAHVIINNPCYKRPPVNNKMQHELFSILIWALI